MYNHRRLAIGLVGHPGTGKTTLSKYLEKEHDFKVFEGSTFIKTHAQQEKIYLANRHDYDTHLRNMQKTLGITALADVVLADPADRVIHSGLRTRPDFERLKGAGGTIIALVCPVDICLARMDQSNPKNPKTIEQYLETLALEDSDDEFGSHTAWCIDHADFTLDTSRPLVQTQLEIDAVLSSAQIA